MSTTDIVSQPVLKSFRPRLWGPLPSPAPSPGLRLRLVATACVDSHIDRGSLSLFCEPQVTPAGHQQDGRSRDRASRHPPAPPPGQDRGSQEASL